MDTTEIRDRLIKNAFDYLARAARDFEDDPKYSLIHFAAAIELFLKARLMTEHWSLVVHTKDGKQASWQKFLQGDFVSVTPRIAFDRLKDTVQSPLTSEQEETFLKIANHRNKLIHFYHGDVDVESSEEAKAAIAKEQSLALYHLKYLLTSKWRKHFLAYAREIREATTAMEQTWAYLDIAYKMATGEILECPICECNSILRVPLTAEVSNSTCDRCSRFERVVKIRCACGERIEVVNGAIQNCPQCQITITQEIVAAYICRVVPQGNQQSIFCPECVNGQRVVRIDDTCFMCPKCFEINDEIYRCKQCGTQYTGESPLSIAGECSVCEMASIANTFMVPDTDHRRG